jgi:hypothetical protein
MSAARVASEASSHRLLEAIAANGKNVYVTEDERGRFHINAEMYDLEETGGKVLIGMEVMPEEPEEWRSELRAAKRDAVAKIGSEMNDSEVLHYNATTGKTEALIGNAFTDLFQDYRSMGSQRGTAIANLPNGRQHAKLRKLGVFAPAKAVKEIAWVFPILPPETYAKWPDLKRATPLYISGPDGHYYPKDFGRGTAMKVWRNSAGNRGKDVYAVIKREMEGFSIQNPKYFGRIFQVPVFMIRHWRPMGVEAIDIKRDTVVFIRGADMDPIKHNISWVMSEERLDNNDKKLARAQMRLALQDLREDYPDDMRDVFSTAVIVQAQDFIDPDNPTPPPTAAGEAPHQAPAAHEEPAETHAERAPVSAPMAPPRHRHRVKDPRDLPITVSSQK